MEQTDDAEPADSEEPTIKLQDDILTWKLPGGRVLRCLCNTGSQIDLVSLATVAALGVVPCKLEMPLDVALATKGARASLQFWSEAVFRSGELVVRPFKFFIGPVAGFDVIPGRPFLKRSGLHSGSNLDQCQTPEGASSEGDERRLASLSAVNLEQLGWWNQAALNNACALFAVPKKDSSAARFVVNLKPQNENTVKMHMAIPDMCHQRAVIASKPYRSQIDFKATYEQVCVEPGDVHKTGFSIVSGTFTSNVMQMGDTNAPETMHRLIFMMSRPMLGRFLEVFFDVISDNGIKVNPAKWRAIRACPPPTSKQHVLRFMGKVNWMADHLPNIALLMAPITDLTGKRPFVWGAEQQKAFDEIKALVPRALKPINWDRVVSGEDRLYVFTDASIHGIGAWIGAGPTRDTAVPYRFHSAKFNLAQRNYSTTKQELLAVYCRADACLKV